MVRRPQPRKSLGRKVGVRQPRRTFALFCEGQRTEPEYLEALKRDHQVRNVAAVELRIETRGSGSVPLTPVRNAVAAKDKSRREEGEVDEFWCVFDVEWPRNHPALNEAITLARDHDIKLAVSNPCFELWLALHFQDHRSFLDNDDARRLRRTHDKQLDKGLDGALYMPRKAAAGTRAAALERSHRRNGTCFPHDNPSSGMHLLLTAVTVRPESEAL